MFPCHRSHYLQRHIVPVSIWIWVKDFRIASEKKMGTFGTSSSRQTSEACTLYCMLLVACRSQQFFDTQKSDPNNLLCLTMGSAWTVVSLNLWGSGTNSKNTQMSSANPPLGKFPRASGRRFGFSHKGDGRFGHRFHGPGGQQGRCLEDKNCRSMMKMTWMFPRIGLPPNHPF